MSAAAGARSTAWAPSAPPSPLREPRPHARKVGEGVDSGRLDAMAFGGELTASTPLAMATKAGDSDGVGIPVRRTFSARASSSSGEEEAGASPLLPRRRATSHDCDGPSGAAGATPPPPRGGDVAFRLRPGTGTGHRADDDGGAALLRTIPSRSEMDDVDPAGGADVAEEARRRTSLYATPTRGVRFPFRRECRGRGRAASSDVVLTVGDDCLPRFDRRLASRIEGIADPEFDGSAPARDDASFSTPERRTGGRPSSSNRDRAHTCPHRPQRHSMFAPRMDEDEESGGAMDGSNSSGAEPPTNVPLLGGIRPRRLSSLSPEAGAATATAAASPTPPRPRPPPLSASSESSSPPPEALPSAPAPSSPPAPAVTIPGSPRRTSRGSSSRPAPDPSAAATAASRRSCLFRVHPHAMRLLMVLSLYVLLAYAWDADLRTRYNSAEINYGLGEYWHGGLALRAGRAERIGRPVSRGKLFNDDAGDDGGRGGGVERLVAGLDDGAAGSASGDSSGSRDDALNDLLVGAAASGDGEKKRPDLSYARSSVYDASRPPYGLHRRVAARRPGQRGGWTLSTLAWALVWTAFAIPLVEAGVREARRQLNVRFWHVRRLRSFRAVPGGRTANVHDL